MAIQPVPQFERSFRTPSRPLSALVDDVLESARGVALQSAELAKLELEEGAKRGALAVAVLLMGSVCLGILAALLWGVLLWGLVWLTSDTLGVAQSVFLLWSIHVAAAVAAGFGIRARLSRKQEDLEG